jgi:beta-phosphoglucomutase family hydrolase
MIKALIFDCDGTLTDSMPVHYRAWREVMDSVDVEFTETRFYELAGVPGPKVMNAIADHLEPQVQTQLLDRREELFFEMLSEVTPITPVIDIARRHRGDLQMAVASGSIRASVSRQLEVIGIADWFETVVTAEDTERHKPEPDVFLEAARRMGADPSLCRVYEDSDLGIEAAHRAGMEVVDVRPLYQ